MKVHRTIFYLSPSLMDENVHTYLSAYISDLNFILEKNTSRRLAFDAQDVFCVSSQPHDDTYQGQLPNDGFDIWVYIQEGNWQYGYMGADSSGAGVISTKWQRVWGEYNSDYQRQVYIMAHEAGHIFGAGISEYYSLAYVEDRSGRVPEIKIDMQDPTNEFSMDHLDWKASPMLWNVGGVSRDQFLSTCKFDNLSAGIITSPWRARYPQHPSVFGITLRTRPGPQTDLPVTFHVFGKDGSSIFTGTLDDSGHAFIPSPLRNAYSNAFLIKLYQGRRFIRGKWISIFDLDAKFMAGEELEFSL